VGVPPNSIENTRRESGFPLTLKWWFGEPKWLIGGEVGDGASPSLL